MKLAIISICIAGVLIIGAFILSKNSNNAEQIINMNNVSIVDGQQIIELRAKGGYQPRTSKAKAGIPTIIRLNTDGTFDCSLSVRIPSMNISRILPQSGVTDIDIGIQNAGTFHGTCGMGMYPFDIVFSD